MEIVISCNLKIVNYLDVTLNLNDGSYKPFHKEKNEILYINAKSNHPPSIIKQLPLAIENRLSKLSSSEILFNESANVYQQALNKSGYTHSLKYTPSTKSNKRSRNRKVIWFNQPYSQSVITNIGKYFLSLIDKHFPAHHKLSKVFNKNTLKISYSCTTNVGGHINLHNRKILHDPPQNLTNTKSCNCPRNAICPLDGNCLEKDILYQCSVSSNLPSRKIKHYKGICSTTFKSRFGNHKMSFNNMRYKNETELSKEVWHIKELGGIPDLKWSILGRYLPYNPVSKRCSLCLNEKLEIATNCSELQLNSRSEIVSKCRHKNRFKLCNLKADVT